MSWTTHELFVAQKVQTTCTAKFQAWKFATAASAAKDRLV